MLKNPMDDNKMEASLARLRFNPVTVNFKLEACPPLTQSSRSCLYKGTEMTINDDIRKCSIWVERWEKAIQTSDC